MARGWSESWSSFSSRAQSGEAIIGRLGQDPIVRNLLLLYSLHPDDLETRVLKALDTVGARLRKFDREVELVSIQDGAVQVRLHTSGHAHGSTTKNLRSIVEEGIYDLAPDLTSLTILGTGRRASSGFVPLESLLKYPAAALAGAGRKRRCRLTSRRTGGERLNMPAAPLRSIRRLPRFASSPGLGGRRNVANCAALP